MNNRSPTRHAWFWPALLTIISFVGNITANLAPFPGNMGDTGIDTTSAAGIFPSGNSSYGVADMAGNVWEWTSSQ